MDAKQLFESGQLSEAISSLTSQIKSNPTDIGFRTFLFELLCFNGDWDRAVKQLDVISQHDVQLDPIAQALMIAFVLIVVVDELPHRVSQGRFPKEDQPVQAFLLHASHETLDVAIQVGRTRR